MEPGPRSINGRQHNVLCAQTIHDLRAPLTVIKAQAQFLERWIHRNGIPNAERALERLTVIDEMVARMVVELDALRKVEPSVGDEPTGGAQDA